MIARVCVLATILATATAMADATKLTAAPQRPVKIIFDTDIGNDVDDALALGVIHALQSRAECELLAVTITKDEESAAPFVDAINTFYGRDSIPIGVVKEGPTRKRSRFTPLAQAEDDGKLRYPHDLKSGDDAPDATTLLRKVLAAQPDNSVAIAQVGFSTNLARLLDSQPDSHSPLDGVALVAQKVSALSLMAGAFEPIDGKTHKEYNVVIDVPSAKKLAEKWPTPMVFSGYEIGLAIRYPAASIDRDYAYEPHHPLQEAYQLYNATPHERPTWDLTSVLWAVRPERGYFDLSLPGKVAVDDEGVTTFEADPSGAHYYLIASDAQKVRAREALAMLSSQPPDQR